MDQIWRRPDHELEVIRPRGDASLGVRESGSTTYSGKRQREGGFGEEAGLATEGRSVLGALRWLNGFDENAFHRMGLAVAVCT
jgi:hypothetical protein